MRLIKAILLGVLLWIFIFIWWAIMLVVPELNERLLIQWMIHFALLIPAGILCARFYYDSGDKMSGFF